MNGGRGQGGADGWWVKQLQCVQSSDARVWRGQGDEAGYVGEGRCAPQQSTLPSVRQTTSIAAAVLMIGAHSPLHIAQRTSAPLTCGAGACGAGAHRPSPPETVASSGASARLPWYTCAALGASIEPPTEAGAKRSQ